nr:MAG TPA: hypothetical protein [Bacteriophage sp.]
MQGIVYRYQTFVLTTYYYVDQTISSISTLLPCTKSSPFPLSCTLLSSSYKYFSYTMISIVVEPSQIGLGC